MMSLKHIHLSWTLLLGVLLLLGAPTVAYAQYLGPEAVLFEPEFIFPPGPREARERVKIQNQQGARRREIVYDALERQRLRQEARENPVVETHSVADTRASDLLGELGEILSVLNNANNNATIPLHEAEFDNSPNITREQAALRRTDRLINRIESNQRGFQPATWQPLHSGAPLIGTGPETTMAIIALLLAGGWTVVTAFRKGHIEIKL